MKLFLHQKRCHPSQPPLPLIFLLFFFFFFLKNKITFLNPSICSLWRSGQAWSQCQITFLRIRTVIERCNNFASNEINFLLYELYNDANMSCEVTITIINSFFLMVTRFQFSWLYDPQCKKCSKYSKMIGHRKINLCLWTFKLSLHIVLYRRIPKGNPCDMSFNLSPGDK